jgi:hypothetical protein
MLVGQLLGASDLLRGLAGLGGDLSDLSRPEAETATVVAAAARGGAPVRTGELVGSIGQARNVVGIGARYAAPINSGSSNRPQGGWNRPTRFIDNAVTAGEAVVEPIFGGEVDSAIARNI